MTVLAAEALLSALSRNTRLAWSLYCLSAVMGLYTHLLFALVLIGHSLYIIGVAIRKPTDRSRHVALLGHFGISSGIAIAAFIPWLGLMQRYPEAVADRVGRSVANWQSLLGGLSSLVRFSTRSLLDTDWAGGVLQVNPSWLESPLQGIAALVIVFLIGAACYRLWAQTPSSVWGIILLPALITLLALWLKAALTERYLLVYFVTLPVVLGYFFALNFRADSTRRNLWLGVMSLVLIAGICSDAVSARATLWSIKYPSSTAQNIDVAAFLNQVESPCLILYQSPRQAAFGKAGEDRFGRLLSLSHWLDPAIAVNLFNAPQQVTFAPSCQTHFVYLPSPFIDPAIHAQGYELKPIDRIAPVDLQQVIQKQRVNQQIAPSRSEEYRQSMSGVGQ